MDINVDIHCEIERVTYRRGQKRKERERERETYICVYIYGEGLIEQLPFELFA